VKEPAASGAEYRREALAALEADDWHSAYLWAKGWNGRGGGVWIVDPWLVGVASALMRGQPRNAVHALDLALRYWIPERLDRAILRWVRGDVIRRRLNDPKSALADLIAAAQDAPDWLRPTALADRDACANEAGTSRKRKPSVAGSPEYQGPGTVADVVARPDGVRVVGARPAVWDAVIARLR
jgi:hypothetical protein